MTLKLVLLHAVEKAMCGLSSIVLVSLQGQSETVTYFGHSCQLWYPFLLGGSGDYHSR
jgi:hypothetical protein